MAPRRPSPQPEPKGAVVEIPVGKLLLDPKNPRLVTITEGEASQGELLKLLWRQMAVDEIAMSIATSGFHRYEPLFAEKTDGKWTVIEGNRRLAAVQILRDPAVRDELGATDLPTVESDALKKLDTLPVIECTRSSIWQWIGFKHVNGPQVWGSYAKAAYIAWVHEEVGQPLAQIARRIGDRHTTVRRLYYGLCVLRQAEDERLFDMADSFKTKFSFSHLYTSLDYPGIQGYLGLSDDEEPKKRPIAKSKYGNLKNVLRWLYGSKREKVQPVVMSQNPDLRRLAGALESVRGVTALERGLPLTSSWELAQGEDRLLRQMVQQAKDGLTRAIGYAVHGYSGEADLLKDADAVRDLANRLHQDLLTHGPKAERRTKHAAR